MNNDGYFDEQVAANYDEISAARFTPDAVGPAVDFLVDLAGDGRALEFATGTGRIAIPLAGRGVPVTGVEMSVAMTERLHAKPGGEKIDVVIGDMATTRVDGSFKVAYLVFNTIMNLTTLEAQIACFQNAAYHLEPGGHFVIEVGVPKLQNLPHGETVRPFTVEEDRLGFDEYDIANQGLISHHLWLIDGVWERHSLPFRYVWSAELDLMAKLAGMERRERWSSWKRDAFTSDSLDLISVWQKV